MITETEFGLPYARIFDPIENRFTLIKDDLPIGQSWYPTNALLPNGQVLITGGLYQFTPDGKVIYSIAEFSTTYIPFLFFFSSIILDYVCSTTRSTIPRNIRGFFS